MAIRQPSSSRLPALSRHLTDGGTFALESIMRQCQTNANQTAKCAKRIASGCQLTPLGQRGGPRTFIEVGRFATKLQGDARVRAGQELNYAVMNLSSK